MKTILSPRRGHYLARVSIFLIAVALIAGMAGCNGNQYNLTILSTEGGEVTTPGVGTFTYGNGTVVDLVVTPDAGYRFDKWTPDVGTIADVNAAETTITVNSHYSITAHFVHGQEIRDWYDLHAIWDNLGGHHRLMNDLDSTTDGYQELTSKTADGGKGWQPIETFTGSFDGQGYEIRDLFVDRPDESGVGLFGYIAEGGVVEDIGVLNATVTGKDNVGGLVGRNGGTVSNSYSSSNVTGSNYYIGGLVGWNQGTVSESSSSSNVTSSNKYVGGLVGWNQHTVHDSSSSSKVTASNEHVGGLVGWNQGTVSESSSSSNVTGRNEHVGGLVGWNQGTVSESSFTGSMTGDSWVGGLVGWNDGTVSDSYSAGSVTGYTWVGGLVGYNPDGIVSNSGSNANVTGDDYVGGLVGWNGRTVSNSYSTGSVSGDDHVGGLVGDNHDGTVNNSYSTGRVTGNRRVGGLVGYNEEGSVSNSYSTGSVTGDKYIGGLVGYNEKSSVSKSYSTGNVMGNTDFGGLVGLNNEGTVINSFWDRVTSGMEESNGGTGKTTVGMQDIATFTTVEWKIITVAPGRRNPSYIWNIVNGVTYPFLSWES